jgi:hypothetical protein
LFTVAAMICAIDVVAIPIAIACALIGAAVIVGVAVSDRRRRARRHALPQGAEAVLLSMTEVVPDPRNLFAIKDPTSELRLSDVERRMALDAAEAARHRDDAPDRPARLAALEQSQAARRAALAKRRVPAGASAARP